MPTSSPIPSAQAVASTSALSKSSSTSSAEKPIRGVRLLSESHSDVEDTAVSVKSVASQVNEYIVEKKHRDQLDFWRQNKSKYPQLFTVFKYLGAVPAESTPSERLFSKSGCQVTPRRNKLSSKKVEALLFLMENDDLKLYNIKSDE